MKKLILLLSILLFAVGCAETPSKDSNPDDGNQPVVSQPEPDYYSGAKVIDSEADLPACNSDTEGQLFYLQASSGFVFCNGTDYQGIDLRGADGVDAQDGVSGTDGISIIWKGSLTAHPENPEMNWAYYNSLDGIAYIYDGQAWQVLAMDGTDTDGSTGTAPIYNVEVTDGSDYYVGFYSPVIFDSKLCFMGQSTTGIYKIYYHDGTSVNSIPVGVSDYQGSYNLDYNYSTLIEFDSKLFFCGDEKLFYYDGTQIFSVDSGTSGYDGGFISPIIAGSKLYFGNSTSMQKEVLFQYDGSQINKVSFSGIDSFLSYNNCFAYNSKLYVFASLGNNGVQFSATILEIDGIEASLLDAGTSGFSNIEFVGFDPILYNSKMYFLSDGAPDNPIIFEFDGLTVNNVNVGTSDYSSNFEGVFNPIIYNAKLYFQGSDSSNTSKIYAFDGSIISNIDIGTSDYASEFDAPLLYESNLYFRGTSDTQQVNVYMFNGSQINDTIDGLLYPQHGSNIVFDTKLYFANGWLRNFDGSDVTSLQVEPDSKYQGGFSNSIAYNNNLYFLDYFRLFMYNGTVIKDFYNTSTSDYMTGFDSAIEYNVKLFFRASKINGGLYQNNTMYYIEN